MPRTKYPLLKCLHRGEKGFTLIELLVVIAILGVIAAVAVPNVTKFMGRGETEAKAAELHNVVVAASAACYEGTDHKCVAITPAQQIIATLTPTGVVGTYLMNDTSYYYTVTDTGQVEQFDSAGV